MENTFACWNILFILIYRHKKNPTKTCVTINRSKLKTKVLSIRPIFFSGLRPSAASYWTILTEKCSLILNMDDTKLFSSNVVKFTVCGLIFISLVRLYFFQILIVFFDIVTNINIFNSIWIILKPHPNKWSMWQQRDVKVNFKMKDRQLLRYEIFRASS